jgi:hypothetical protein
MYGESNLPITIFYIVEDGTMREPKTKEIDGVQFSVTPFPASEAFKLKAYLFKKFAPAAGELSGILKDGFPESGKIGDIKIDGQVISQTLEKLVAQLGEEDFLALIKRIMQNVCAELTVDGKDLKLFFAQNTFDASLDIVFSGRLFSIYPVLLFVLEANYPDFFGRMAGNIGGRIRKIATSGSPGTESNGKSKA